MSAPIWRVIAGVVIFGVLAGLLVTRWVAGEPEDPVVRMAREGADAYSQLAMTPIASVQQVQATLDANAEVSDGALWNQAERDAFLRANAEFLWLYFGEVQPDGYLRWRERGGYVLRERDEVFSPPEQVQPVKQVLADFWSARQTQFGGTNQAVELAADRRGVLVVLGEVTAAQPFLPESEGTMGAEYWHGGVGVAGRSWWKPQQPMDAEPFLAGRLSIVLGFADGSRKPMLIQWHLDEHTGQWLVHSLHVHNSVGEGLVNMDF